MNISIFWDTEAFILVILTLIASLILYFREENSEEKVFSMINFAHAVIIAVTLGYSVYALSNLTQLEKLGPVLAFVILSNFYISIINVLSRIYFAFKKHIFKAGN
jgi:hypothetical protein